jgi:flagellar export protein FliJ
MAFRFALAAVLKFRETMEQQAYLALELIQQEIAQIQRRIRKCEERIAVAAKRRETELRRGIASIHLQAAYDEMLALQQQREALQAKLRELQVKHQECLKAYEEARQKREVLADLRTRQIEAYRREQLKREQKMLDDIFLSRRKRSY